MCSGFLLVGPGTDRVGEIVFGSPPTDVELPDCSSEGKLKVFVHQPLCLLQEPSEMDSARQQCRIAGVLPLLRRSNFSCRVAAEGLCPRNCSGKMWHYCCLHGS